MKKILFVLLLSFVSLASFSQANTRITLLQQYGTASDTITNSGTGYVGRAFSGAATAFGFQAAITKVSGTVAGTIVLSGSIDGTNYHTISSQNLTDTAGTKYYIFTLDGNTAPYTHYRLTGSGGTTCVYYLSGIAIGKK